MPDRGRPGSRWFAGAWVVGVVTGVAGLIVSPSPSVRVVLDQADAGWAVALWSVAFTCAALAASIARWRRWYFAEAVAADIIAAVFLLWAGMVLVTLRGASAQGGLAFLMVALFLHGWSKYRRRRLDENVEVIREAVREVARAEARADGEVGP